jgi:hypothetical protein
MLATAESELCILVIFSIEAIFEIPLSCSDI